MLTKVRYPLKAMLLWTRVELLVFLLFSAAVTAAYHLAGLSFLQVPWAPVAVIGTAVAFIVSFQNNAAYGRIWEARKIWGGIVNASRTWGIQVSDMVTNEHLAADERASDEELAAVKRVLVRRHIGWMTALRHAMRQRKSWEEFEQHRTNREWQDKMHIPEKAASLAEDLAAYLEKDELEEVLGKGNKATAILTLQSRHLRQLKERGLVWEFAFLELERLLQELFTLQGKSERIKNFPYPRQYATLSHIFVRLFSFFIPFAAVPEFASIGVKLAASWPTVAPHLVWVAVPFCTIISWIFHTMERIGRVGENPFEGSANDVPISTIARGIEIDLRQMLGEDAASIPEPLPEVYSVQM
jgi:putative membrane protein